MANPINANDNNRHGNDVEEPNTVKIFLSEFFMYLYEKTGFTKRSFTQAGLQNHVKDIAKKCFQLQIYGDLLKSIIDLALIFSNSINDNVVKAVEVFVMVLHKIMNFFVKYFLGVGVLMITPHMFLGMRTFLISLYHVVCYVIQVWSYSWFLKLKNWILMLFSSNEVRSFFEEVFANYGRALTMA